MRATAHGFLFNRESTRMDTNKDGDGAAVAAVSDRRNEKERRSESDATDFYFPNSKRVYVAGKLHPEVRVPFREISLAPTKSISGDIEVNESVRVYDTSGPWGDPDFHGDVEQGLPPLRAKWIRDRSDVEEYEGRAVTPIDDGYLSIAHAERSVKRNGNLKFEIRDSKLAARRSLRARPGKVVTQLWCARHGIITPEMEFIAIREGRQASRLSGPKDDSRDGYLPNNLRHQHPGQSFGAAI